MKLSTSNSSRKKYKALMLDVDGTTIENRSDAMPSRKVKDAIGKANKVIKVGLATSRPFWHVRHIIEDLKIKAPCIIAGGTQIFDPQKNKIIWEKLINASDIKPIFKIAKQFNIEIFHDGTQKNIIKHSKDYRKTGPIQFWIPDLDADIAEEFINKLSNVSTIAILKMPSRKPKAVDILITHAQATKQHGIFEVSKLLRISTHDMIAVGDGDNDFPLLMACGLKIAMGNATEELKKIADFVAPSVEEDGVAMVIEKFIL